MLRWGSHLWHALRRRRFFDGFQVALNPAVRRVRKDLVKGYAKAKTEAKDKPASKAIEEFFHRIFVDSGEGLLSRASFWKWYIERHLKVNLIISLLTQRVEQITITEDNKLVSDEAFITALCKGGPPDDDDDMKKYKFHLIDQRLPPQNKRMFLPTMIDSQEATSHTSDDCNAVINILRNEALREVKKTVHEHNFLLFAHAGRDSTAGRYLHASHADQHPLLLQSAPKQVDRHALCRCCTRQVQDDRGERRQYRSCQDHRNGCQEKEDSRAERSSNDSAN
jgi:hypothetical protein